MKNHQRTLFKSLAYILTAFVLVAQAFPVQKAYAAQIVDRSLTLQAGASGDGGSKPGGVVNHLIAFRIPTDGNVGSIKFEYCTLAGGTCTVPTGLHTDSGSTALGTESGATGWTLDKTTNGAPFLHKTATNIPAATLVSYQLLNVTNPTSITNPPTVPNQTFFVRISTYASEDATGTAIDRGTVAASTTQSIDLTGTMPESLIFCTGAQIGKTADVPDCAKATSGAIEFNQLFSPTDTASATSQMSASTNAGAGYTITVHGTTLTSGSNTVAAMNTVDASKKGVSQFGMNLKLNTIASTTVPVGAEVDVASNGTNYRGRALTGYEAVDRFKYATTDPVADSGFNALGGSDAQIFTVSYIVNVPGSQPAGTYTTTLTYICTPTF